MFLDYNQNAKDRTVASAYSVRPTPDARVSMPVTWDELAVCDPGDFTLATVPALFKEKGDAHANIDQAPGSLDMLLELSARQAKEGQGDAPWPPHYAKQAGEPARVMPSRAKGAKPPARAKMPLIVVAKAALKADALAGPRALEGAPSRGRREAHPGRRAGRRHAWPLHRVVPHPGEPAACPGIRAPRRNHPGPRLHADLVAPFHEIS